MNRIPLVQALNQLFRDLKEWITNNFATKQELEDYINGNK